MTFWSPPTGWGARPRPQQADIVRVSLSPGCPAEAAGLENPPGWRRLAEGCAPKARPAAISHHYDVSNAFYQLVLRAVDGLHLRLLPRPDASLEEAQDYKFDLVCRKLGLRPGMRLLDVGCGWGGMVRHAVAHYGVRAVGVTLSAAQAAYGQAWIAREGLGDRAEIRHGDYREITESGFGRRLLDRPHRAHRDPQLSRLFRLLAERLRDDGGLLLNHCITRPNRTFNRIARGGFINRLPRRRTRHRRVIISAMADQGFGVRHAEDLREHYARTCRAWARNLSANWDAAVAEAGVGTARVGALSLRLLARLRAQRDPAASGPRAGSGLGSGLYPLRPEFRDLIVGPGGVRVRGRSARGAAPATLGAAHETP